MTGWSVFSLQIVNISSQFNSKLKHWPLCKRCRMPAMWDLHNCQIILPQEVWLCFSWLLSVPVLQGWMCVRGCAGCLCSWWRKWSSCSCACTAVRSCRRRQAGTVDSSRRSTASDHGTGDQRRTGKSRGYSSCWGWPATWRWWRLCLVRHTKQHEIMSICLIF